MSEGTTKRRKAPGATRSFTALDVNHNNNTTTASSTTTASTTTGGSILLSDLRKEQAVLRATVRRNFLGTGPFDKYWLNLDCCGLFCACLTYGLHLFGVYAVTWILLPPWMSYKDADDNERRHMTMAGTLHQLLFTSMALLACWSHFKAMCTDPGAVPPDAKPLPQEEEMVQVEQDQRDKRSTETQPPQPQSATASDSPTAGGHDNNNNNNMSEEQQALLLQSPSGARANSTRLVKKKRAPQNLRLCRRCKAFKPQRAHHCSICKRCIIKMDHHCPWVNNCVGLGNHKYFLLFVFYTFVTCTYSMCLIILRFSSCVHARRHYAHHGHGHHYHQMQQEQAALAAVDRSEQEHGSCVDHPSQLLTVLMLLIESLLFGIFTSCMMFDQMEVVQNKMTHIDRLKGIKVGGNLAGMAEVFGLGAGDKVSDENADRPIQPKFQFNWLSPFQHGACFPASIRDEVVGYCLPVKDVNTGSVDNV